MRENAGKPTTGNGTFTITPREWSAGRQGETPWNLATVPSAPRVAIVSSVYYEIRVGGLLPPDALLDFERLMVSVEPVKTVLHGPVSDQAALHGLLARLELFGAEVVEVRRLSGDPDAPPAE
jgi:hypothetical protein